MTQFTEHGTREAAHSQLLGAAAAAIDAELPERALVYGSTPPAWRDLDLVVSPHAAEAAARALAAGGFVRRGSVWARFSGCLITVVELLPENRLRGWLDLDAVLAEARPLVGMRRIVAPAPHHALAILAGRLAEVRELESKHRERIAEILREDPTAWQRAAISSADADQLGRLRRHFEARRPKRRSLRLRPRRPPRAFAVTAPGVRRTALHAKALADALSTLGYRVELVGATRSDAISPWAAVVSRLHKGGVIVLAAESWRRPPRLAPRLRRWYVVSDTVPAAGTRVMRFEERLATEAICERIASDAWDSL